MRRRPTAALLALLTFVLWGAVAPSLAPDLDRPEAQWRNLSPFTWLFQGVPVEATFIPTPIQSMQAVTATFAGGSATATATLTTALKSTSNALLFYQGHQTYGASGTPSNLLWARGTITNTTTITVTSGSTPAAGQYWRGQVIEFIGPFVRSGNCGSISISNGSNSNTATLTGVTAAKTAVAWTGGSASSSLTMTGSAGDDTENTAESDLSLSGTTLTGTWTWNGTTSHATGRVIG
jgi:hypothetical protein